VDLTDTATAQMGKAFGDFVTTGKLDFASLIDSILADFARMEAQKGITEFFGYVLSLVPAAGGASGASGVGSGTGASSDLPSSSYSGLAAGPTVAPLAGGSSLGGPSISAPVTVNISNGAGGIQSSVQGGTQQGQDLGQKLRGAIVQVLIDEQRPGGALNSRG
jgi:lambda family phage tail tape measure protein